MNKDFNVYKWRRDHLTEGKETNKQFKVSTLTIQDIQDYGIQTLPISADGVARLTKYVNTEEELGDWKSKFIERYGDADLIISPDTGGVKPINNTEWDKYGAAVQQDYNKNRSRYQGD
jgi:hypothetical protein